MTLVRVLLINKFYVMDTKTEDTKSLKNKLVTSTNKYVYAAALFPTSFRIISESR